MSLRASLKKRRVRREPWKFPTEDIGPAMEKLEQARRQLTLTATQKTTDDPVTLSARQEVERAEAELRSLYEVVWFEGIPQEDLEALIQAHPPVEGQTDSQLGWNPDTLYPELLSVSQVAEEDADRLSPKEWAAEMKPLPRGDKQALLKAVRGANFVASSEGLPKD